MTVYISGPITGNPNYVEDFWNAWVILNNKGLNPVSPVDIGIALEKKLKRKPTWDEYMREDIKALMDCEAIYMLPGWRDSRGSCLEKHIALQLGMVAIEPLD